MLVNACKADQKQRKTKKKQLLKFFLHVYYRYVANRFLIFSGLLYGTASSLDCVATNGGTVLHYRGADESLARSTSRCILFDGENISFDASLVMYINSTNIPPIVIINRIYEPQNLLSL